MKAKLYAAAFCFAAGLLPTVASATVIDFEDLGVAVGDQLDLPDGVGVTSRGFNYTPGPLNTSGFNDLHIPNQVNFQSFNGTTIGGTHDDVVLTEANGETFSLHQFDFAGFPLDQEAAFSVTGSIFGGGTIMANFTPDGIVDGGPGGDVDFETFVLGQGWTNLTSVTWVHSGPGTTQGSFALDNIVVNAIAQVPEPGTLALFGLGLAGLGFARRRKAG